MGAQDCSQGPERLLGGLRALWDVGRCYTAIMKFGRPRSLNGLILVGFGLVALPLLVAVLWALVNLGRLAEQSEQLIFTGVAAAENNRLLEERLSSLERVARQYQVLRNPDSLLLLRQDLDTLDERLLEMAPLTSQAGVSALSDSIGINARRIVDALSRPELDDLRAQLPSPVLRRCAARSVNSRVRTATTWTPNSRICRKARVAHNAYRPGRLRP